MNAQRRKKLEKITEDAEALAERLGELRDEEETAFDNLPESLQDGERGTAMQDAINAMEEAASDLENFKDLLNSIAI